VTERKKREPAVPLAPVVDPADWGPEELRNRTDWIYRLTDLEVEELDSAVRETESRGLDTLEIGAGTFRVPNLERVLLRVRDELMEGFGVAHLRNVPVQRYDRRQAITALWIISSYLGDPVPQNRMGHMMGHIRSLSREGMEVPSNRAYHITGDALPFHPDSCDVVGLLSLKVAKSGGLTRFVSSVRVYNELLARRPELVKVLTEPFYRDRREEIPEGKEPYFAMPVFMFHEGYLVVSYQGTYLHTAQRFEDLPRFTDVQREALAAVEGLAEEFCLEMPFEVGDLQFLHNHVTMHARTPYEDFQEEDNKRHLLRMWLATPNGRPLPPPYGEKSYLPVPPGGRPIPGVYLRGVEPKIPIDPEV
jgi:Taurine catabolism dioxygenase TauD, TfdA family